ncbi:MAG: class B sortase [Lachnospiraceae bacterium]|nr:class B sortase [Lachnospiraceae bacterium]
MGQKQGRHIAGLTAVLTGALLLSLTGCAGRDQNGQQEGAPEVTQDVTEVSEGAEAPVVPENTGWEGFSAADKSVDFSAIRAMNPDIYAWVYVPGTGIDYPVCQSPDDIKYESADALGNPDANGWIFSETANLKDMCDFNTILHGSAPEDGSRFSALAQFLEPQFFEEHRNVIVEIEGNRLTYEIIAAYRRKNTSLLRLYDFTYEEGCNQFITNLMMNRDMSMQFRTGYEDISPYNFLLTLTAHTQGKASEGNDISLQISQGMNVEPAGEQIVVLAVLSHDEAGTIDREMADSDLWYDYLEGDGDVPLEE